MGADYQEERGEEKQQKQQEGSVTNVTLRV